LLASVADYRELAKRRLARIAFDYLDLGAEDGAAIARNRAAFDRLLFAPRVLRDVADVDLSATVLGERLALPVVVGPTGLNGLYWPRAEEALARAAHAAGVPFVLSTASTSLIEDVRAACDGALWFQLYVQEDRSIAEDLMRRAWSAGCTVLMLTVDTPVHGTRDHDIRNGFRLPLRATPSLVWDLVQHPGWCLRMLRQRGSPQLVNLAKSCGMAPDLAHQASALSRQMDRRLGWDAVAWLREHWRGKVLIKGILSAADAEQAVRSGVDGIVLSNHGGRQLESVPSPIQMLPEVLVATGGKVEVLVDGGVRRGADVAKARALGASAVLLGRAPLYGLAARGAAGVGEVLALIRDEYATTLRLLGVDSSATLDAAALTSDYRARLG
jgi:(S)-mandelate dehydrogenase